jgi:hypothetical protein
MEIQWVTPAGNINTIQETVPYSFQLVALSTLPVTFKVLAGSLPVGLRLSSTGLISGTPHEVNRDTESKFVIRAATSIGVADRTFTLKVIGADTPSWVTQSGFIPAGVIGTQYVLDNSYVDFQLEATDSDTIAGDVLTYRLLPNAGQFPPGLTLSPSGRITGYTQPILALDFQGVQAGYDTTPWDTLPLDIVTSTATGFDDYLYDVGTYDYSVVDTNPVRLSRAYTFSVEVSDGFTEPQSRIFKIYVVTDDFLVQNNIPFQRVPIWITDPYLGRIRANNNITILLDVYDPPSLPGLLSYFLVPTNPDNTASTLPPGLTFDAFTGNLQGSIPKQIPVTTRYQFTVMAVKFTNTIANESYDLIGDWNSTTTYYAHQAVRYSHNGLVQIYICKATNTNIAPIYTDYWYTSSTSATRTFSIDVIGEIESSIEWVTPPDLGTIQPYHQSTLQLEAISLLPNAQVSVELKSGSLPKGLSLLPNGNIIGKAEQNSRFYDVVNGINSFDVTFDMGTTIFGTTYNFTVTAHDATNVSEVDRTFSLTVADTTPTKYCNLYVKAFLSKEQRNDWYNFITDGNLFLSNEFYRPGDVHYGVQTELRTLIYAGIEDNDAVNFVKAVSRNHNKKQMLFGDIKYATAYDPNTQEPIYEVVYVEMIDDIAGISPETSQDLSDDLKAKVLTSIDTITIDSDIPFVSDSDKQQVFPNSIENMRARIANSGVHTSSFLPLWMKGIYSAGYASALVLCYVKPGNAPNVLARIKAKLHTASRGNWTKEAAYQPGDTVFYLGFYYTCIENNTNTKPDSVTPVVSRGNWNNTTNYLLGDNVFFSGKYYTSLQTNTNKPPHTSQVYWMEYQPKWSRNFDFKALDFTADRYVIDSISDAYPDKYLAFPNNREN